MSDTKSLARRRAHLLEEDPHCAYCGRLVRYWKPSEGEQLPDDFATIEHVHTKIGGNRPQQGKTILACYRCNQDKGREDNMEYLQQTGIQVYSTAVKPHLTVRIGDLIDLRLEDSRRDGPPPAIFLFLQLQPVLNEEAQVFSQGAGVRPAFHLRAYFTDDFQVMLRF